MSVVCQRLERPFGISHQFVESIELSLNTLSMHTPLNGSHHNVLSGSMQNDAFAPPTLRGTSTDLPSSYESHLEAWEQNLKHFERTGGVYRLLSTVTIDILGIGLPMATRKQVIHCETPPCIP